MTMANSANSVSSLRRILVGIRTIENSDTIKLAKFVDCLVNYFSQNKLFVNIGCKLEGNVLVLYTPDEQQKLTKRVFSIPTEKLNSNLMNDFGTVVLQHSPYCPFKMFGESEISSIPKATLDQGVYVGVAVVLESSDSRILLTQRSDHMRSFPGAWVPPGGNIEYGEGLIEGGLRELQEETGLAFHSSTVSVLCLWESVYPAFLSAGQPRYHHAVVYLHVTVPETASQLQNSVKLDPEEVQACTWLSWEDVKSLVTCDDDDDRTVMHWRVSQGNKELSSHLATLSSMFRAPWVSDPLTGVQAALHAWLKNKDSLSGSRL